MKPHDPFFKPVKQTASIQAFIVEKEERERMKKYNENEMKKVRKPICMKNNNEK